MGKRGLTIMALLVLIAFFPSASAEQGCFTEPSYVRQNMGCGQVDYGVVDNWCKNADNFQDCISNFIPGAACEDIAICSPSSGWCEDSCDEVAMAAYCEDREKYSAEKPYSCTSGCCVCNNGGQAWCDTRAEGSLFKTQKDCTATCDSIFDGVLIFNPNLNEAQCTNSCGTMSQLSSVKGYVTNNSGSRLGGVSITSFNRNSLSDTNGYYEISELPSGSVSLRASKPGYSENEQSVILNSGEQAEINLTLQAYTGSVIRGTVKSRNGYPVEGAAVSIGHLTITTDSNGAFSFNIPYGAYIVYASKSGYRQSIIQAKTNVSHNIAELNFSLDIDDKAVIYGTVKDTGGIPIRGVQILLDGIWVTFTQQDGSFSTAADAGDTARIYEVTASSPNHASQTISISIQKGEQKQTNFSLTPIVRECGYPANKPVTNFAAGHIPGQKAVKLSWQKPCAEVRGYIINRTGSPLDGSRQIYLDVAPGYKDPVQYIDDKAEWDTNYEYSISAVYSDISYRLSNISRASIITGNESCEGKYSLEFLEFCEHDFRKTCNENNQVVYASTNLHEDTIDCSTENAFCSQQGRLTFCKSIGECSARSLAAEPFGLWFNRNDCYGGFSNLIGKFQNFCYFDKSNTIFDACFSCSQVKSCFDYKGKDACTVNNCLPASCNWIDANIQLGTGYCVPENYNRTDRCSECGPSGNLFRNALCTPNICTGLGACYSDAEEKSCLNCAETSCYDYNSVLECNGGINPNFQNGFLISSKDSCSLKRCRWESNSCFKDGNADGTDDCTGLSGSCREDNIPPKTKMAPDTLVVNSQRGTASFTGTGEPRILYYCLDHNDICEPNTNIRYNLGRAELNLTGLLTFEATNFFIRYYSTDQHFNREDIQSKSFTADLKIPTIEVSHNLTNASKADFLIVVDEPAQCTDTLKLQGGSAMLAAIPNERNNLWQVSYSGLGDGIYTYTVKCRDDYGNEAEEMLFFEVDADNFIKVVSPPIFGNNRVSAERNIIFIVNTSDTSVCRLYEGSSERETLVSSDGIRHQSNIRQFEANRFYTSWNIRCTEESGEAHSPKYVLFSVDLKYPASQLKMVSADGLIQRFNSSGFAASSTSKVNISFECSDEPQGGYGCKEIKYCTGGSVCEPSLTGSTTISNLSVICFKSEDKGGNTEPRKCGIIEVNPSFGIQLVKPKYGTSHLPRFDLEITSKVPADICKWARIRDFNFATLRTESQTFERLTNGNFFKLNFSDNIDGEEKIYIKCNQTATGIISPPQMFTISYDPTSPEITKAYAEPGSVIEDDTVTLHVETNEDTLCKYDKAASFGEMAGKFEGFDESIFKTAHSVEISVGDQNGLFVYNVSCMNKAENVSSTKPLSYTVDLTAAGTITDKEPSGIISNRTPIIKVTTNKDAACSKQDGSLWIPLSYSGRVHGWQPANLTEGDYSYHVKCSFAASRDVEGIVSFKVDTMPPIMKKVEDYNYTCSLDKIKPAFEASDNSSINRYYYIVNSRTGGIIANGSSGSSTPVIDGLNLTQGAEYIIKAKAEDAAGNLGNEMSSDGFRANSANSTECLNDDPPVVSVNVSSSSRGELVTLTCRDESSCYMKFGTAATRAGCNATTTYTGPELIRRSSYFCYTATDASGKQSSGGRDIIVNDEDGDGITDSKDKCPDTTLGEDVDSEGCATSQLNIDTDKDGLPDNWEKRYDEKNCELNYREADSDGNGVDDGEEDYDSDSILNKDEYKRKSDPCSKIIKREEQAEVISSEEPGEDRENGVIAIVMASFGLLLILAGGGYLGYDYYTRQQKPKVQSTVPPIKLAPMHPSMPKIDYEKIRTMKEQQQKHEDMKRKLVFSQFGSELNPQPLVQNTEEKKTSEPRKDVFDKLTKVSEKYKGSESAFEKLKKYSKK